MPELPDVEIYRKRLQKKAVHHILEGIAVNTSKVVKLSKKEIKSLTGHRFTKSTRWGKLCFLKSGNHKWLALHFGMTGNVATFSKKEQEPEYAAVTFVLKGKNNVSIISRRKLGKVEMCSSPESYAEENELGIDALECTKRQFLKLIQNKKGGVKSVLMDQSLIAGLGNVYTDEILYQAGIHPKKKTKKLKESDLKKVYIKMKSVLKTAIKKEADPQKLASKFITPLRGKNASCPSCAGKLKKIRVSGRSTYYCPSCQKK